MSKEIIDVKVLREFQLGILDEIDSVCKKNDIEYSLDCGTLLGAVRHKGYIPWDDDIDIIMSRENYDRFVALPKTVYKDEYSLIHFSNQKKYPLTFAKVENNKTELLEDNYQNMNFRQGVYVDIFVADRVSDDPKKLKKYLVQLKKSNLIKYSYNLKIVSKASSFSVKVLRFFAMFLNKIIGLYKLNKKEDALWKKFYGCTEATKTFGSNIVIPHLMGVENLVDYDIFNEYINIEFEGKSYRSIKEYDRYLTKLYGDYMQLPPVEKRVSHHGFVSFKY